MDPSNNDLVVKNISRRRNYTLHLKDEKQKMNRPRQEAIIANQATNPNKVGR